MFRVFLSSMISFGVGARLVFHLIFFSYRNCVLVLHSFPLFRKHSYLWKHNFSLDKPSPQIYFGRDVCYSSKLLITTKRHWSPLLPPIKPAWENMASLFHSLLSVTLSFLLLWNKTFPSRAYSTSPASWAHSWIRNQLYALPCQAVSVSWLFLSSVLKPFCHWPLSVWPCVSTCFHMNLLTLTGFWKFYTHFSSYVLFQSLPF